MWHVSNKWCGAVAHTQHLTPGGGWRQAGGSLRGCLGGTTTSRAYPIFPSLPYPQLARDSQGKIRELPKSNPPVFPTYLPKQGLDTTGEGWYLVRSATGVLEMNAEAATAEFVSRQSPPLEGTASAATAIARVNYSHDAMIDLIIARPGVKQGELAKHFGYTQAWVSRVMNSDAFLARLAQRKNDLVDPAIALTIDERLRAVAAKSLDVVLEKLELAPSGDFALEAAEMASKALGYGARQQNLNLQQNFVVAMPQKADSAESWAGKYTETSPARSAMAQNVSVTTVEGN